MLSIIVLLLLILARRANALADFEVDETRIIPPLETAHAMMAFSVRLDKSTDSRIIVGSQQAPRSTPAALIYRRDPGQLDWILEDTLVPPAGNGDQSMYGENVAIDGDYAAVSSELALGTGCVYIYQRSGSKWSTLATLPAPGGSRVFGSEIAIAGGRLLVAAKRTSLFATGVDYFLYTISSPSSPTPLAPLAPVSSPHMVYRAVALTATHAFIAYPAAASLPSFLFIYNLQDSSKNMVLSRPELTAFSALSASPSFLAVGNTVSPFNEVIVYRLDSSGTWVEDVHVPSPERDGEDLQFGYAVAIDDDRLVVGAPGGEGLAEVTGSAFSYTRQGASYAAPITLAATNGIPHAFFGRTVSIGRGLSVIGAFGAACTPPLCPELIIGAVHIFNQSNTCGANPLRLSAICDVRSTTLYYFHSVEIQDTTVFPIPVVIVGNLTINAPIILNFTSPNTIPISTLGCISVSPVPINITVNVPPGQSIPIATSSCIEGNFGAVGVQQNYKDCEQLSADGLPVNNGGTLTVTISSDVSKCGKPKRNAKIIGGVIGGLVLLSIGIAVLIYLGHVRRLFTCLDCLYRSTEENSYLSL